MKQCKTCSRRAVLPLPQPAAAGGEGTWNRDVKNSRLGDSRTYKCLLHTFPLEQSMSRNNKTLYRYQCIIRGYQNTVYSPAYNKRYAPIYCSKLLQLFGSWLQGCKYFAILRPTQSYLLGLTLAIGHQCTLPCILEEVITHWLGGDPYQHCVLGGV